MALTYEAYRDVVQGLREHPEWRADLRPLVLGEDVIGIPARITSLEATVEYRFQRVEAILADVAVQTARNTEAISGLEAAIRRLEGLMESQTERMNRIEGRFGQVMGTGLEERCRGHLVDFYSRHAKRPRRLIAAEIPAVVSATDSGAMPANDRDRLLDTDILVAAQLPGTEVEVILTSEISFTVNVEDVERAEASAEILRRLGLKARGFVGGHSITEAGQRLADRLAVIVDLRRQPA